MTLRIVFFGTPDFAVPTLDALATAHEVTLVVAQPDKPSGRGLRLQAPAVALRCLDLGLALAQPNKIRDVSFLDRVRAEQPDLGVVIAYGKLLPGALLTIPRYGFLNVHGSKLPRYRGAAPVQRAIEHGDRVTGVTIMRVDEQLDHGPILTSEDLEIGPHERAPSLFARMSRAGAHLLVRTVAELEKGSAIERPQDDSYATFAPKIEKSEGLVNWNDPSEVIYNRFRAFDPWPGLRAGGLKLLDMAMSEGEGVPGHIIRISEQGIDVAAGQGALRLITLQRPGKSRVSALELARGSGWRAGSVLDSP